MKIENQKVVKMEYTLTNEGGETLDTSVGREPLEYVQGVGAIIPGLEKAMEGKIVGDKFKVEIAPNDGYGERNDSMIQEIPKDQFGETELAEGMQFQVMTGQGAHVVTVMKVEGDVVSLVSLKAANVITKDIRTAKIVLSGEIARSVTVKGLRVTKGAKAAIEAAGGKIEE